MNSRRSSILPDAIFITVAVITLVILLVT